jgi:hypothetical protein
MIHFDRLSAKSGRDSYGQEPLAKLAEPGGPAKPFSRTNEAGLKRKSSIKRCTG